MSLPPAIIDQLLTGYLDEVLTADELAQVEKLLQNEPAVAEELAKLQELRLALKSIALADDDIRLDAGFAERVVDEAVLRARAEGLADEHPLLQLEEQGKSNVKPVATVPTWRVAAVMVGLAASIALALVLVRSDSHRGSGNSPADVVVQVDPGVPVPEEQRGSGFGTDAGTAIVSNRKDEPLVDPVGPGPDFDKPLEAMANNQNANKQNTDADSSVATKDTGPKPDQEAADMVSVEPNQPAALGIIAVYHVELTDLGREQEAFKNALTLAGLSLDHKKKISEAVVGLSENPQKQAKDAKVIYLQAPAKALDRLYLRLLADRQGVKGIGMSLATNAPLMRVVNAVRQDPTVVRHESSSLQLLSDDESLSQLTATLQELDFIRMSEGQAVPSGGFDETAEVLLLVQ